MDVSTKKKIMIIALVILLFISASVFISANLIYARVFPNFRVGEVSISSLTIDEAKSVLSQKLITPETLKLVTKDEQFEIITEEIDLFYNIDSTVINAYGYYRNGNVFSYVAGFFNSLFVPHNINASYNLDEQKLLSIVSAIAVQVETEPVYPSARIENGELIIMPGDKGTVIDRDKIISDIKNSIINVDFKPIPVVLEEVDPTLDDAKTEEFRENAEKYFDKSLVLIVNDVRTELSTNDILQLINYNGTPNDTSMEKYVTTFSQNNNKNPQNSIFNYENGAVEEFVPSKEGTIIQKEEFLTKLHDGILKLKDGSLESIEIVVPITKVPPEITTDQVNDLGIKELVGKGSSTFKGSISSRIHNIGVASNKFNGTLVKPGEVMSFNNVLGDVSEYTGYQKAYVIKDGQTVLGDGGGVCQVSTTLFRAALDAGLPIVERRAHSYRVTYYEQGFPPGLDATVYAPTTDLKIKNDTPGHLLIQTIYNPVNATLDFEIYGTNDGRIATTTKPVITSSSPPPEDLYIDDPTLPQGQVKQIDWAAWGAKVNFDYRVVRDGETIFEKTFFSNFQPWQAKYLRGTAPVN